MAGWQSAQQTGQIEQRSSQAVDAPRFHDVEPSLGADTLQQRNQPALAPLIPRRERWPRHVVPKPAIGTRAPKKPCYPNAWRICVSVAHRRDFSISNCGTWYCFTS